MGLDFCLTGLRLFPWSLHPMQAVDAAWRGDGKHRLLAGLAAARHGAQREKEPELYATGSRFCLLPPPPTAFRARNLSKASHHQSGRRLVRSFGIQGDGVAAAESLAYARLHYHSVVTSITAGGCSSWPRFRSVH